MCAAEADLDRWFGMQGARADTEASVLALRAELAAAAVALSRSRRQELRIWVHGVRLHYQGSGRTALN